MKPFLFALATALLLAFGFAKASAKTACECKDCGNCCPCECTAGCC